MSSIRCFCCDNYLYTNKNNRARSKKVLCIQCSIKGKEYVAFNKQVNQINIQDRKSVMQCRQSLLDYIYIIENNEFTFDEESIAKRRTKALINQYFEQHPDLKDELIIKKLNHSCNNIQQHSEQSIIDYLFELDRQNSVPSAQSSSSNDDFTLNEMNYSTPPETSLNEQKSLNDETFVWPWILTQEYSIEDDNVYYFVN